MAHKSWKNITIKIDNATQTLTEITSSVNTQSLTGLQSILEDSALGDEERTYLPGLAGATVSLNGFVNSTTDGIFGPLIGNHTSVPKTLQVYNGQKFYYGEAYPTNVAFSGNVDTLVAWSSDFTFSGAVTRSSTTAA